MQAAVFLIAIDLRVTDSLRLQRLQPGGSRLAARESIAGTGPLNLIQGARCDSHAALP